MPTAAHELVLTRTLDCTPEAAFRCWTDPALIVQWFTPPPFKTIRASNDVRAGGFSNIVMQAPDGTEIDNPGVFLEVVPNRKLVFTDAYTEAWVPSAKPFMTGILTFEPAEGGKTLYTARVVHWSAEDRKAHEDMGFHEGWGVATDQLEALARTL